MPKQVSIFESFTAILFFGIIISATKFPAFSTFFNGRCLHIHREIVEVQIKSNLFSVHYSERTGRKFVSSGNRQ